MVPAFINLDMKENKRITDPVPRQYSGSQMDAVEKREFETAVEADKHFQTACSRLLSVNRWGEYAGLSEFVLIDESGDRIERLAREGDYIRIDIPGPGTQTGKGYDWVKITEIIHSDELHESFLSMTVRPCKRPNPENDAIAHFLKKDATSTFIVKKQGLSILAEEHGRNEMPNTSDGSLYDKGRNFMVGMAAKIGLSYPQWKSLVKAFLSD